MNHYCKCMNGSFFEKFIADNFDEMFEKCGAVDSRLFIQDGDQPKTVRKLTQL